MLRIIEVDPRMGARTGALPDIAVFLHIRQGQATSVQLTRTEFQNGER